MHTRPLPSTASVAATTAHERPLARLGNALVDPVAAFRGIAADSPWAVAFGAIVAVRFASLFVFYRPAVTPLKLVAGVLFQVVTTAPLLVVASTLVWIAAKAWRVALGWVTSASIVAHVYLAYTVATVAIASVAGALLPDAADVDLRHPPYTNLASLTDSSAHPVLFRLLAEVDVRGVYAVMLLWLALRGAVPHAARKTVTIVAATVVTVRFVGVLGAALMQ